MMKTALMLSSALPLAIVFLCLTPGCRWRTGGPLSAPGVRIALPAGFTASGINLQVQSGYQPEHRYVLRPLYSLEGHLHNKIIHIPIGFGLAAMFLSLLALWRPEYQPGVRWLVLVAAVGAVAAVAAGLHQAVTMEGGSKDWVIGIHKTLGITTMLVLWIWAATQWIRPFRRWSIFVGVTATLLILITGFYGGVLAHG
jgi:uncharacterized membrane protein